MTSSYLRIGAAGASRRGAAAPGAQGPCGEAAGAAAAAGALGAAGDAALPGRVPTEPAPHERAGHAGAPAGGEAPRTL